MPRTGPYEIRVVDREGNRLRDLKDASIKDVSWELNGVGTGRISIPTLSSSPLELVSRELQVVSIGEVDELVWWGVPWALSGDHRELEVECATLLSYFEKRYLTFTSLDYTDLDQLTIAWNLLSHAQTGDNMSFNIDSSGFSLSGKVRSRRYERNEHGNILDLLSEFPTLRDGFDYDIVTFLDGRREWTPYYPRKGSNKSKFPFEWRANIESYRYREDADDMANEVYVTGGTAGEVKFEANYTDPNLSVDDLILQAVVSEGSQKDIDWLQERAEREVAERSQPVQVTEITATNNNFPILDSVETGDVVPIGIDHGRVQVEGDFRIVGMKLNSDRTVKLTINEEAA